VTAEADKAAIKHTASSEHFIGEKVADEDVRYRQATKNRFIGLTKKQPLDLSASPHWSAAAAAGRPRGREKHAFRFACMASATGFSSILKALYVPPIYIYMMPNNIIKKNLTKLGVLRSCDSYRPTSDVHGTSH
jgi:hypothetical protein